jgi:hypothetical protein
LVDPTVVLDALNGDAVELCVVLEGLVAELVILERVELIEMS